jgi:hypothetical protein
MKKITIWTFGSMLLSLFIVVQPILAADEVGAPVVNAPTGPTGPETSGATPPTAPEPPKSTAPAYNPPPPSGKDWGKLPQADREKILNDWKALPEKDREPFIFYRERAMSALPDSAYSENPYVPDTGLVTDEKAKTESSTSSQTTTTKTGNTTTTSTTTSQEKSSSATFFDKLMGNDDKAQ